MLQKIISTPIKCVVIWHSNETSLCHQKPELWIPHHWQAPLLQHLFIICATEQNNLNACVIYGSFVGSFSRAEEWKTDDWKIWEWRNYVFVSITCYSPSLCCQWFRFTLSTQHNYIINSNWLCLCNTIGDPKIYMWLATLYEACEIL